MTSKVPEHAHAMRGEVHELLAGAGEALKHKHYEQAWQFAMAAMSRDMDSAGSLYVAGQIALARDYPGLAANMLRRACSLRPDIYSNWLGFGAALLDMRQFEEAEECFLKAIKLNPKEATGYANMSALELNRGRPRECIEWASKSIDRLDHPAVRSNRGFAYLMLKQWAAGFDEYKFSMSGKNRVRRIYRQPEEPDWDGTPGQTVVVQAEQGIGDEISFASMIPDLAKVCKKVIIDCHPKLTGLFTRAFPECDVYGTRKEKGLDWPLNYEIDASLPMSCMGTFFRREDADFPRKPWLTADDDRRAKWREWLARFPGPHIGIAWTGGNFLTNRQGRSATLDDFAPLIKSGGTCFSLEYRDEELALKTWNEANPNYRVINPPIDREDYDDTAAFLMELDHVVSVTTTVVHACGALGRSCWCIVPSVLTSSQWRYGIEGDDMLWYPPDTVRMFRQKRSEQGLSMVIRRIVSELPEFLKGRE